MISLLQTADAVVVAEQTRMGLWQLFMSGGWLMWVLLILGGLTIFIFVERFMAIRKASEFDMNFMNRIRDYILDGKVAAAVDLCRKTNTPIARMIEKGIGRIGRPMSDVQSAIENVGFLASIPLWLVTLLGCLVITVLAFLMILTVYGRFFKLYLYAALSPVALASFAGEGTSQMGRAFLKSYMGVCLEGAVIVLACIVFSAFAASDTVVLGGGSVVTQVWGYLGEVIFNMLVLVGLVKGADRVVREMFGM